MILWVRLHLVVRSRHDPHRPDVLVSCALCLQVVVVFVMVVDLDAQFVVAVVVILGSTTYIVVQPPATRRDN